MESMMEIIRSINGVLWGTVIIALLIGAGIYFTICLRGVQIRYFTTMFTNITKSMKKDGGVSGFGALCAAVGGQVGTGNLVGVATAIVSGGPGAIFWMWVTAVVGMASSFIEIVLGLLYREKGFNEGTYIGGPTYYIQHGLKNKFLAGLYGISAILGVGIMYPMLHSNSIAASVSGISSIPTLVSGLLLMAITGIVVFGGVKRLANVATILVPFMALAYLLIAIIVIILNLSSMPAIFSLIFESAFNTEAVAGGVFGHTMREAIRFGVARGLFSNDVGTGASPVLHASANVKHPVNQGISAMLGVFVDTIIVCSCTAIIILASGALESGFTGAALTQQAMSNVMGASGPYIICLAMVLFGFTSLLVNLYIGEVNLHWFFTDNKKAILIYRITVSALVVLGATIPVTAIWDLVDFAIGLMVLSNVTALLFMSKKVTSVLKNYEMQIKDGIEDPTWDYEHGAGKL